MYGMWSLILGVCGYLKNDDNQDITKRVAKYEKVANL